MSISEGHWLKAAITARGTVVDFAKRSGVSRATLNNLFQQWVLNAEPETLLKVIETLGFKTTGLRREWAEELAFFRDDPHQLGMQKVLTQMKIMNYVRRLVHHDPKRDPASFDANVEPYSEQRIAHEIPLFELSVAAGGWVDVSDNEDGDGQHVTDAQLRQGLFRVRIRGDSMEPKFPDGSIVEFRLLISDEGTPDVDAMKVDHCYYVQLSDGTATFKQLVRANDDDHELVLSALNPKYKRKLRAPCADVARVAAFEWILSKGN